MTEHTREEILQKIKQARNLLEALELEVTSGLPPRSSATFNPMRADSLACMVTQCGAQIVDILSPIRRGKSRLYYVRKALGYTYP